MFQQHLEANKLRKSSPVKSANHYPNTDSGTYETEFLKKQYCTSKAEINFGYTYITQSQDLNTSLATESINVSKPPQIQAPQPNLLYNPLNSRLDFKKNYAKPNLLQSGFEKNMQGAPKTPNKENRPLHYEKFQNPLDKSDKRRRVVGAKTDRD